ncbi:hypothetical protein F2P81_000184 [Scophthalmus maximus]|uniref:Uncharacterized protein n=1 Tax=Scophthalmus maximus TaxID=52904 RepID=A0A6A4TV54_SCOMX|nr:hypothetical protein F2P81_000184 [Scophthalmus maximus]
MRDRDGPSSQNDTRDLRGLNLGEVSVSMKVKGPMQIEEHVNVQVFVSTFRLLLLVRFSGYRGQVQFMKRFLPSNSFGAATAEVHDPPRLIPRPQDSAGRTQRPVDCESNREPVEREYETGVN